MSDLISRQAAIDACLKGRTDGLPATNVACDCCAERIRVLPSAEPEIIRCKDCKHWHREIHTGIEYFNFSSCDLNHYGDGHNFYCADAERRTDG